MSASVPCFGVLKDGGYPTTVGDEGSYAPHVSEMVTHESILLLTRAIERRHGYKLGVDFGFALDVAASELYKDGKYNLLAEPWCCRRTR